MALPPLKGGTTWASLIGSLQTRVRRPALIRHTLVSSENITEFQNRLGMYVYFLQHTAVYELGAHILT